LTTKLCAHVIRSSNDAKKLVTITNSPIVKFLDDFQLASEFDSMPRRPFRIGRAFESDFDPNPLYRNTDPIEYARIYFDRYLANQVRNNPDIDAWEGPNEPHPENLEAMRWYARFEAERIRILSTTYNRKSVVGNFSAGAPDLPTEDRLAYWRAFGPALFEAKITGGCLGLHEYSNLDFSKWDSWLFFRYRWAREYCISAGLQELKFAVTECGADSIVNGRPWRTQFGGNPRRYLDEMLKHYDAGLRQDSYVLGAAIFTFGNGWFEHNVEGTGLTDLIIEYDKQLQVVSPTPAPALFYNAQVTNAGILNVRAHPWSGKVEPPKVRQLVLGAKVFVTCTCNGWACISPDGNEWVSQKYLRQL